MQIGLSMGLASATKLGPPSPPPLPPANTALPTITGTARVGSTLTASTGTWTNSPTSYERQWKAGGANINGATGVTYVPVAGDVGKVITCTVTASNSGGSAAATSAATAAVLAAAPSLVEAPVMSGTPAVGRVMTCTNGVWANSPTSYGKYWRVAGVEVSTDATYTVQAADVGKTIYCRVDASNTGGSAFAFSNEMTVTA